MKLRSLRPTCDFSLSRRGTKVCTLCWVVKCHAQGVASMRDNHRRRFLRRCDRLRRPSIEILKHVVERLFVVRWNPVDTFIFRRVLQQAKWTCIYTQQLCLTQTLSWVGFITYVPTTIKPAPGNWSPFLQDILCVEHRTTHVFSTGNRYINSNVLVKYIFCLIITIFHHVFTLASSHKIVGWSFHIRLCCLRSRLLEISS